MKVVCGLCSRCSRRWANPVWKPLPRAHSAELLLRMCLQCLTVFSQALSGSLSQNQRLHALICYINTLASFASDSLHLHEKHVSDLERGPKPTTMLDTPGAGISVPVPCLRAGPVSMHRIWGGTMYLNWHWSRPARVLFQPASRWRPASSPELTAAVAIFRLPRRVSHLL